MTDAYVLLWSHEDEHHDHLRAVGIDPHDWEAGTPLVRFANGVPVEIVGWSEASAPEDACLSRDFSWAVDLLNEQAREIERLKEANRD